MITKYQYISSKIKKEADELMEQTGLHKILSKYGKVSIHGSYALDLMLDGDIDINIINKKNSKKTTLLLLNELINRGKFRGYFYYDHSKNGPTYFPRGHYIGLKTLFNNKKWKIDLWLLNTPDIKSKNFMTYVSNNLDNTNKEVILKLKNTIKQKNLPIPSNYIYRAVIDDKVKTLKQLKNATKKYQ